MEYLIGRLREILRKAGSHWKSLCGPWRGLFLSLPSSPELRSSLLLLCPTHLILSSFSTGLRGTHDHTLMFQSHLHEGLYNEDKCLYVQIYISGEKKLTLPFWDQVSISA